MRPNPPNTTMVAVDRGFRLSRDLHRWLQVTDRALRGPFVGETAPVMAVLLDGQWGIQVDELSLTDEAYLQGDAILAVL